VDVVLTREGAEDDLKDFVVAPYFPKVNHLNSRPWRKTGGSSLAIINSINCMSSKVLKLAVKPMSLLTSASQNPESTI